KAIADHMLTPVTIEIASKMTAVASKPSGNTTRIGCAACPNNFDLLSINFLLLFWTFICFRERIAVINDHDHADGRDLAEFPSGEHRDANAAVAGGRSGNRRIAVNGYTVKDVIRVIERSERAFSPSSDLAIDIEPARRSDGFPRHAAFGKELTGTR